MPITSLGWKRTAQATWSISRGMNEVMPASTAPHARRSPAGPRLQVPTSKVCSATTDELNRWVLSRSGRLPLRCGTCRPVAPTAFSPPCRPATGSQAGGPSPHRAGSEANEWEIDGPDDDQERRVSLWTTRYIPSERLTPGQLDARAALRVRLRRLAAATGEIPHASYAGLKPANADTENLLLYNIDATAGGCFQPSARHGLRFELTAGPSPAPPSGRPFGCLYQYRLASAGTGLTHWRPGRLLASFTTADLGRFPAHKCLEQVWLAIHRAQARTAVQPAAAAAPFAVLLTLYHPATIPAQGQRAPDRSW
jgi:hypothetical protein